jgi:hypothetical protein
MVISNSYDNQKCDFSFLGGLGWPVEDPFGWRDVITSVKKILMATRAKPKHVLLWLWMGQVLHRLVTIGN